jgi:hypothetical protein
MEIKNTLSDRQAKISAEAQAPKTTKIPDTSLPLRRDGTVQLPWISRFEHKR